MMRSRALPTLAGGLVIVIGLLTVAGWAFKVEAFKTVFPGLVSMKVVTAACFVLNGAALLLRLRRPAEARWQSRLAQGLGLIVATAGVVTLAEYVAGRDLGLDHLLFRESAQAAGTSFPGRMSPASAFNFLLLGIALLGLDWGREGRRHWLAQYCALAAGIITLLAFVGYFYGVETLYQIAPYATIALHTVLAFCLLCLGILFARPERGLMALFTGDTLGGMVARRMLPGAVLVPLLLGWLRVLGQRAGFYGLGFGVAMFATALIVIFAGLIAWAARALNRIDTERHRAVEALERSKARLDGVISSAMDAVISIDPQQRVVLFNPAAERMFGVSAEQALGRNLDRFIPERFRSGHAQHIENFHQTGVSNRRMGALGTLTGLRANGSEFPIEASISQTQVGGEKLFTVIVRNISERRQAEAELLETQRKEHARRLELEALMEATPAIVWLAHDRECRLITANRAGQEILRMPAGLNVSKTAPEGEAPQHFQVFRQGERLAEEELPMQVAGRTGQPALSEELEVRFSDGTSRWIYGNAVPLLKPDGSVQGVVAAFVDITALKNAEQELRASREQMRGLAGRLQAVREEERTRLAREFHDGLAQELTRLKLDVAWLGRRLAEPADALRRAALQERLTGMSELTDAAIACVQRLATELRPVVLDSLGLCAAIEWQVKDFGERTGIRCSASLPESDGTLDREVSTALFRILQEALTNVARHAQATEVAVKLERTLQEIWLSIRDNGQGIGEAESSDPLSVGLLGMRERATLLGGQCQITGEPGKGTAVLARFPLAPTETDQR